MMDNTHHHQLKRICIDEMVDYTELSV